MAGGCISRRDSFPEGDFHPYVDFPIKPPMSTQLSFDLYLAHAACCCCLLRLFFSLRKINDVITMLAIEVACCVTNTAQHHIKRIQFTVLCQYTIELSYFRNSIHCLCSSCFSCYASHPPHASTHILSFKRMKCPAPSIAHHLVPKASIPHQTRTMSFCTRWQIRISMLKIVCR